MNYEQNSFRSDFLRLECGEKLKIKNRNDIVTVLFESKNFGTKNYKPKNK